MNAPMPWARCRPGGEEGAHVGNLALVVLGGRAQRDDELHHAKGPKQEQLAEDDAVPATVNAPESTPFLATTRARNTRGPPAGREQPRAVRSEPRRAEVGRRRLPRVPSQLIACRPVNTPPGSQTFHHDLEPCIQFRGNEPRAPAAPMTCPLVCCECEAAMCVRHLGAPHTKAGICRSLPNLGRSRVISGDLG